VIDAVSVGATLGEIEQALHSENEDSLTVELLKIHRSSEMFEELRTAIEAYVAKTGTRPKIFLANMGPVPQHKARSDFSNGFFEIGGFETLRNKGFLTVDEAAEAAIASGALAVVICSTDDSYPEIVPLLTRRIKIVKPDTIMILAGYPKEHIETFKAAGIDEFIHLWANMYEILVNLMRKLGILS
jgi:methylmalonyl-CoA mutase